jgi:hypothetical protein
MITDTIPHRSVFVNQRESAANSDGWALGPVAAPRTQSLVGVFGERERAVGVAQAEP